MKYDIIYIMALLGSFKKAIKNLFVLLVLPLVSYLAYADPAKITDIPIEVFVQTFQKEIREGNLSIADLINFSTICRGFIQVRNQYIHAWDLLVKPSELKKLEALAPEVRKLSLDRSSFGQEESAILAKFKDLQVLRFMEKVSVDQLPPADSLPNLVSLHLKSVDFRLEELKQLIPYAGLLKELGLDQISSPTYDGKAVFEVGTLAILREFRCLKKLDVPVNGMDKGSNLLEELLRLDIPKLALKNVSYWQLEQLIPHAERIVGLGLCCEVSEGSFEFLNSFPRLRELNLGLAPITDASIFAACFRLEKLYLGCSSMVDLSTFLPSPSLRVLDLHSSKKFADLRGIENLPCLEVLDLSCTAVKNISLLKDLRLKELYLAGTQINDASLLDLPSDIEVLNLSDTQVTSIKPLVHLKRLKILKLERVNITAEEVEGLKSSICGLAIKHSRKNQCTSYF